jgi:quercetin dioxygenase-like cupin family protein
VAMVFFVTPVPQQSLVRPALLQQRHRRGQALHGGDAYNSRTMITRRNAVALLSLFAPFTRASGAAGERQVPAPATQAARPPVFKHDLPTLTMDDWEVTVSHVEYAPGRVGTPHRHAGFVLAYVLEGSVVAKISGQGEEKTYTVGQMFYEQPGATHEVSRNASASERAMLLAMIFAKKGATLTTPVDRGDA